MGPVSRIARSREGTRTIDLRSARALAVNQHGHRKGIRFGFLGHIHVLPLDRAPAYGQDLLAGLQEQRRRVESGIQQAAGVVAEVEQQAL